MLTHNSVPLLPSLAVKTARGPTLTQLDANDGTLNFVSTGSKTRMVGVTDKGW